MSHRKLFPNETNRNRANAGSEKGIEGRAYPNVIAQLLNADKTFRRKVCKAISKNIEDFEVAVAGSNLPSRVENIVEGGKPVTPKTNLRIIWKNGTRTNFRTTISDSSQIHLQTTNSFIEEFSVKCRCVIPEKVQDALRLFSGSHQRQKNILESIPVGYVGEKVHLKVEVMTKKCLCSCLNGSAKTAIRYFSSVLHLARRKVKMKQLISCGIGRGIYLRVDLKYIV